MTRDHKGISIYGRASRFETVKYMQRVRIHVTHPRYKVSSYLRKTGAVIRYTRTTKPIETRFDIYGKLADIRQAEKIIKEKGLIPKEQFQKASAKDIIKHPEKYGKKGVWVEKAKTKPS